MAEKRAKDRVILELVGLAGHVYTDQDIPDMKNGKPVWEIKDQRTADAVRQQRVNEFEQALRSATDPVQLVEKASPIASADITDAQKAYLRNVFIEVDAKLGGQNG